MTLKHSLGRFSGAKKKEANKALSHFLTHTLSLSLSLSHYTYKYTHTDTKQNPIFDPVLTVFLCGDNFWIDFPIFSRTRGKLNI